ncbi:DUF6355 family natural product biosynthesis protein [Amycolatopsis magusensis]|nr:DUF6355 family natural product biosynthesis protein [Amycolatopsis magusensis]
MEPSNYSTNRIRRPLGAGVAVVALLVGGTATASAAPLSPGSVAEKCGYLGWGKYNHCDGGSGATVMLDVEDLWGGISLVCVRPGITDVQPYVDYRVTGAWWNGGVGCAPGGHS